MKCKSTKQANKTKKNKALLVGLGYRYAGLISARQALKAGEHKMIKGDQGMININITVTNNNPNTIANRLAEKLGRKPTDAELRDEVKRILKEARI